MIKKEYFSILPPFDGVVGSFVNAGVEGVVMNRVVSSWSAVGRGEGEGVENRAACVKEKEKLK